jgi:hypothetical protein
MLCSQGGSKSKSDERNGVAIVADDCGDRISGQTGKVFQFRNSNRLSVEDAANGPSNAKNELHRSQPICSDMTLSLKQQWNQQSLRHRKISDDDDDNDGVKDLLVSEVINRLSGCSGKDGDVGNATRCLSHQKLQILGHTLFWR